MGWFYHALELVDGGWACHHGRQPYDTHAELEHAIEHLRALAAQSPPAELILHHLDGRVERLGLV
jgi:hypothetical protein